MLINHESLTLILPYRKVNAAIVVAEGSMNCDRIIPSTHGFALIHTRHRSAQA